MSLSTFVQSLRISVTGEPGSHVTPPSSERVRYTCEPEAQIEAGASRQSYHATYGLPRLDTLTSGSQSSNSGPSSFTRTGAFQLVPLSETATNASRWSRARSVIAPLTPVSIV